MRLSISMYMFLLLLMLCCAQATAQTGKVKGKVTDAATRRPLPSAGVRLLSTSRAGTASSGPIVKRDGTYEINNVPPGSYTLQVRYVGYKTFTTAITVKANDETTSDPALTEDAVHLDEIVVVGAASRTSKSVAEVAVTRVDTREILKENSYTDIGQLLMGKVPGVTISPSSGNIGGSLRFQVRNGGGLFGNGTPTIYVDGARIFADELGAFTVGGQGISSLYSIDPEEIDHIEILKGAASGALYGTSGSNGVVLITTKHGDGDAGPMFQYKGTVGFNEQAHKYTADDFLSYQDANDVFRKGYFNQHSLSLNGQSGVFNYFASFGSRLENGS